MLRVLTGQKIKMETIEETVEIAREDYERIIKGCIKEFELMKSTLKSMVIAAKFQKVTFDAAVEEISKLPKKKK